MILGVATFYHKLKATDETTIKRTVRIEEPSIQAKSWYQMNNNRSLSKILTLQGNIDDYKNFTALSIGDSKYFITGMSSPSLRVVRIEVGN